MTNHILNFGDFLNEAMMRQHSIDQLNAVDKIMGNMDIGDRVKHMGSTAANLISISKPFKNMESYEDYMKKGSSFIPNWNVNQKSLDPYKNIGIHSGKFN